MLKYFVKAAETLNFSEASKELFISQSTLSQQITQLESELGNRLFQRNSHEVQLTEAGEELLPYARKTLEDANLCLEHIRDLKELLTGELNIGVTYSFSSIMTETLMDFLKKHPGVRLNICYKTMEELIEMLLRRELDIVLAYKPSHHIDRIDSHILFNNRLAAVVKEDHPLSKLKQVSLDELEKYTFVLPAKGLQARNALHEILRGKPHQIKARIELNNVNVLLRIVRETNYITVLSESAVIGRPGLKAIPLNEPGSDMEGCVHLLKDSYMKASVQEFLRMLSQSSEILRRSSLSGLIE